MGRKKMKEGIITDGEEEDRISNLPESLIHHILSFLMMRQVRRTSLLSSRWRNIWKSVPVLNFERMWPDLPGDKEFIRQSLNNYEGQKIKKLHIRYECWSDEGRFKLLIRFAAMHGVEELDIDLMPLDSYYYSFPSCLSKCLEMRILRLSLYDSTPRPFRFPLLTELHFTHFRPTDLDVSACALLQVLIIEGLRPSDSLEIYAPNPKLRYLKISEPNYKYYCDSSLTLYAPNLLYFEFEGSFRRCYEFKDISSVQTVNLESSVLDVDENGMFYVLVELLGNLSHVKSLKLYQSFIQMLACGEMIGLEIPSLTATCLELKLIYPNLCLSGLPLF